MSTTTSFVTKIDVPDYMDIAEGGIEPATRQAHGEINQQDLERMVDWLRGDSVFAAIDLPAIPTQCIDGRKKGEQPIGFNAAAGTFSLVMGDALTHSSYRHKNEAAPLHAERLYRELIKNGYQVGGHTAVGAVKPCCGCGAEDQLDPLDSAQPSILGYLTRRGNDVRDFINRLGLAVPDALHERIIKNAAILRHERYAANGYELCQAYINAAGPASIVSYNGPHQEVVLVLNYQDAVSLDYKKLWSAFGTNYQAFSIDISALRSAMLTISLSPAEAEEKFIAALYYNIATTAVLAGPSLRIVVH